MKAPLYKCMTKATTAEGDQMKYGPNWAFPRRGMLKVYEDRLECGDWKILISDISDSILYSIRSTLFIPGYVLKIETKDRAYHLGLNWSSFWKGKLPFPARREKGRLGYSVFSVIIRILLFGYLGYLLWIWIAR